MIRRNKRQNSFLCILVIWSMIVGIIQNPGVTIEVHAEPGIIASGSCGDNLEWTLVLEENGTRLLTIFGNGAMTDSSPWSGYSVSECIIENGVTSIGDHAFRGCNSLKSIILPEGVTSVGDYAFYGCDSLKSIVLPDGVTSLGREAFYGCKKLEYVRIPRSLRSFDSGINGIFEDCPLLKTAGPVDGGYNIEFAWDEIIPDYAFKCCKSLESIEIPENITAIGSKQYNGEVFYACENLKEINIPNGITSIGWYTFSGCKSLEKVEIPDSITKLNYCAFSRCSSLREIELPKGLTDLDRYTFDGCTSLNKINIPEGVTSIGDATFRGCASLEKIILPEKCGRIADWAFEDCSSLKSIVIPSPVQVISKEAFCGCKSLESVYLTGNTKEISDYAFDQCTALKNVYYDCNEAFWNDNLVIGVYNQNFKDAVHHYGENLGSGWYSSHYKWIIDGKGILHLLSPSSESGPLGSNESWQPFSSSIKQIDISEGFTVLGWNAFKDFINLTTVSIPLSMGYISDDSFAGCTAITEVYYPGTQEQWDNLVKNVPELKNAKMKKKDEKPDNPSNPDDNSHDNIPDASSVVFAKTTLYVEEGKTEKLTWTVLPVDAKDKSVTFASSDTKIATIDTEGVVTAVATGAAKITVKTTVGGYTAECGVTVIKEGLKDKVSEPEVASDGDKIVVPKEQTKKLDTTVSYKGEKIIVDVATTYQDAISYTGGKIDVGAFLDAKTDKTSIANAIVLNEKAAEDKKTAADMISVSYVCTKKNAGVASFYAKVTVSKDAKKYMSSADLKKLKKIVTAVNKKLKKDKCSFTINKRSVTDGTLTINVQKDKAGAIKLKKGKAAKVKSVVLNTKDAAGKDISIKMTSKEYSMEVIDAETGLVKITGKKNFTGSIVTYVQ